MLVNRFSILTLLGYFIAKKYGYGEKLSGVLGVSLALQYAIWKNINRFGGKRTKKRKYGFKTELQDDINPFWKERIANNDIRAVNFCGESFWIDFTDEVSWGGVYWSKPQLITYERFLKEKQKIDRLASDNQGSKYLLEAFEKEFQERGLNEKDFAEAVFGKYFFQFWKQIRDKFRTKEFWKKVNQKIKPKSFIQSFKTLLKV